MKEPQPADRDVERVRRALRSAAPSDVTAVGRADEVVRRGQQARSRRGMASAAAVGLAAAAIVIGPHLIDGSPVTNDANAPSNASPSGATALPVASVSPYANPCPAAPLRVPPRPAAGPTLHNDVVMVRLCRAQAGGVTSAWQPPQDALVSGVDGFAARVAALPQALADPCPAARVAPEPFGLQLTDSAGRTQTVSSMFTTCGTVLIDSRRVAADRLLDILRQSLAHQRQSLTPQPPDTTLTCGSGSPPIRPTWNPELTAQTAFVAATTCATHEFGGPKQVSASAIQLLSDEWSDVRDLSVQAPLRVNRCPGAYLVIFPLYAMTTKGDVVMLRPRECGDYRTGHFQFIPSRRLMDAMELPYQPFRR